MSVALTVLVASTLAPPAPSEPATASQQPPKAAPRVEPFLDVTSKLMFRTLVLDQGDQIQRDRALLWKPVGLWGGVQWYYARNGSFDRGGVRGDASLGVELISNPGRFPIGLQHSAVYVWKPRPRLGVLAGLRLGMAIDLPRCELSHAEFGLPLGLATRRVELQWTPSISVPLGFARRTTGDSMIRIRAAVMYMPINVTLRINLGRNRTPDHR